MVERRRTFGVGRLKRGRCASQRPRIALGHYGLVGRTEAYEIGGIAAAAR